LACKSYASPRRSLGQRDDQSHAFVESIYVNDGANAFYAVRILPAPIYGLHFTYVSCCLDAYGWPHRSLQAAHVSYYSITYVTLSGVACNHHVTLVAWHECLHDHSSSADLTGIRVCQAARRTFPVSEPTPAANRVSVCSSALHGLHTESPCAAQPGPRWWKLLDYGMAHHRVGGSAERSQ
jgi:hypothetical protein